MQEISENANDFARALHCFSALESIDDQFDLFSTIFDIVSQGGDIRVSVIGPTIASICLGSIHETVKNSTKKPETQWYTFLLKVCMGVANARQPCTASHLLLLSAVSASEYAHLDMVAYECFEQTFMLFEESIPDSKDEINVLYLIISSLYKCHIFDEDNRSSLAHKAASYCSKLLKRKDQCLAVLTCSHVYWQEEGEKAEISAGSPVRNGHEVVSCLKRALRIAQAAQQQGTLLQRSGKEAAVPGHLFVEILNKYLYFLEKGVPEISSDDVNKMIELTASEVLHSAACQEDSDLQKFYKSTVEHIKLRNKDNVLTDLVIPQ